jgi:hypothetical protein
MLTYAELTAPSQEVPGMTVAALALTRMQSATSPMPPKGIPAVSAAEIASWQSWVSGGLMPGTCGGVDAGPPDTTFQGAPICASGQFAPPWTGDGSSDMTPGEACVKCHQQQGGEAPGWLFGGTVFDTGKVKDLCLPPAAIDLTAALVVVHDANGVDHTMKVDYVGNFHSSNNGGAIATPYTAKVTYMGKERVMLTQQTSGDCNTCHTATGKNNAPGRIALPQ